MSMKDICHTDQSNFGLSSDNSVIALTLVSLLHCMTHLEVKYSEE